MLLTELFLSSFSFDAANVFLFDAKSALCQLRYIIDTLPAHLCVFLLPLIPLLIQECVVE